MKIKALVTLLALGSSSVALADSYGPTVRDHRYPTAAPLVVAPLPAPVVAPLPAPVVVTTSQTQGGQLHGQFGFGWRKPAPPVRPVLLANDTRVAGWAMINVSAQIRMFTKLELRAATGKTDIDRIM